MENVRLRFVKEYARFDNIEGFSGSPNFPSESPLPTNNDFDNQGTYTIPSKMNSLKDDGLNFDSSGDDDSPF